MVPIARSLHRHGISVDVASFNSAEPAVTSSSIRDSGYLPSPDVDPVGFVDEVGKTLRKNNHDMLIPADDQALMALTRHYDRLKNLTHIACPPADITNLVLDKSLTLKKARECGIQIPKTKVISNSSQLSELFSTFAFPWVLKPAKKEMAEGEIKSLVFATADKVREKFPTDQEFASPMLLQEYCPGVGVGIEMLMHDGDCVAMFQHRRLKELPYTGGFSVTAVAERPASELVDQSLALLRALKWEGPAMVEFKVNPSSGGAVFMEVNGRYWGTISLPIAAGVDFPLYHWQLAHDEVPMIPGEYVAGIHWRWTAGHLLRIHGLLIDARRSSSARKELLGYVRSASQLHNSNHDAIMTPSDPMPAIFDLLGALRYWGIYDSRAIVRRIRSVWASNS